ncbi:MAG: hypothetical protein JXR65_08945 [Bacteroidales bacterium]|nr:hypothetical protein [Bacteroidales bacterium]
MIIWKGAKNRVAYSSIYNNYKKLPEFINSDEIQVFIFGYSCGISDRTLLNTIFEHDSCASVKVFYQKKEDGNDNFSDVIRNISRKFNDKAKMRDKLVNKEYSEPLISLFLCIFI